MKPTTIVIDEIRAASRIHARLLDAFIKLTDDELSRSRHGFAEESLQELLEKLRSERKEYGVTAGLIGIVNAA